MGFQIRQIKDGDKGRVVEKTRSYPMMFRDTTILLETKISNAISRIDKIPNEQNFEFFFIRNASHKIKQRAMPSTCQI